MQYYQTHQSPSVISAAQVKQVALSYRTLVPTKQLPADAKPATADEKICQSSGCLTAVRLVQPARELGERSAWLQRLAQL